MLNQAKRHAHTKVQRCVVSTSKKCVPRISLDLKTLMKHKKGCDYGLVTRKIKSTKYSSLGKSGGSRGDKSHGHTCDGGGCSALGWSRRWHGRVLGMSVVVAVVAARTVLVITVVVARAVVLVLFVARAVLVVAIVAVVVTIAVVHRASHGTVVVVAACSRAVRERTELRHVTLRSSGNNNGGGENKTEELHCWVAWQLEGESRNENEMEALSGQQVGSVPSRRIFRRPSHPGSLMRADQPSPWRVPRSHGGHSVGYSSTVVHAAGLSPDCPQS